MSYEDILLFDPKRRGISQALRSVYREQSTDVPAAFKELLDRLDERNSR